MRNLVRKAVSYAKRNPQKTKKYAKKAYDTISKRRASTKRTPPK